MPRSSTCESAHSAPRILPESLWKSRLNRPTSPLGRRLRLGVVGGGPDSHIGRTHRIAARMDERYDIVASAVSSNPARSRSEGLALGIGEDRAYGDWRELINRETLRDDCIDVIAVMTPNGTHFEIADAALDAGFDVICDKPLTTSLTEARKLVEKVRTTGLIFCLTHNYSAYPMVRQARAMVKSGSIGEIQQTHLEYVQGFLTARMRTEGDQLGWRLDSDMAGPSLVLGDIGTHVHHLATFVAGLDVVSVMAEVGSNVPGRAVDDYAGLLVRYENGARGTMWITSAAAGAEHGLSFRIFGDEGGLEWHQEEPNVLRHRRANGFDELITRRLDGTLAPEAHKASRLDVGHPEGFLEAFANLYSDAADVIAARRAGTPTDQLGIDFPSVLDGAKGMTFIVACVESSRTRSWQTLQLDEWKT